MKIKDIADNLREKVDTIFKDKVESVIVVDIGSKLTLLNVELNGRIKVVCNLKTFPQFTPY